MSKNPALQESGEKIRIRRILRKAHPDQAGFIRRFLAFAVDIVLIYLVALGLFIVYSEISARHDKQTGVFSQLVNAVREKKSVVISLRKGEEAVTNKKDAEEHPSETLVIRLSRDFEWIQEFVIGYLYFILFFRFGGRPLGKRLFRLKVIDLEGRPRLGWYQAFERTHGYAASALSASLGFLQVLWNHEGLTMHDQLARTTVVKLPRKRKTKAA